LPDGAKAGIIPETLAAAHSGARSAVPECRIHARTIARATHRRSGSNPSPRVPQLPMIAVRSVPLVACDPDRCVAVDRMRIGVR